MRAELHRKDEELSQVKANAQEDALRIKKLWDQVSDAEAQHEEDTHGGLRRCRVSLRQHWRNYNARTRH